MFGGHFECDHSRASGVKSEMPPHLKINLMVCTSYGRNVMLFSKSAQSLIIWERGRCRPTITAFGAGSFVDMTGCSDASSFSTQPFPTGFHRLGLGTWLWHHIPVRYKARLTCCSNASSVGGRCETGMSVVDARTKQSSSRLEQYCKIMHKLNWY